MHELHPSIANLLALPDPLRRIGPFLLIRQLGRGGFAPVWLAKEVYGEETLRPAAVKIFALTGNDQAACRRIVEEARALCRVEHPNVVRFYSLAVDEDAGLLGLGMEYVPGRTLATRLAIADPLRIEQVVELGITLASALASVHRAGLVHRDVKPGNIVETADGYKLIDFGIALANTHFSATADWTPFDDPENTGRVAALQSGTLGYVDPLVIATGAPASSESDLYALGATLYECLTGRLPAGARNESLDECILDGRTAPPSVATFVREMPARLVRIIDRLLHLDRKHRYGSADEVVAALRELRPRPKTRTTPGYWLAAMVSGVAIASGIGTWAAYQRAARAEAAVLQQQPQVMTLLLQPEAEPKIDSPKVPSRVEVMSDKPIGGMTRSAQRWAPKTISRAGRKKDGAPAIVAEPAVTVVEQPPPPKPTATANATRENLPLAPARDW
ncbi:MAG TPA: serine/threonine-protein kinase [Polyangium sp.]|nr:serine/threonine-protein kinase [Polyangium sp.]